MSLVRQGCSRVIDAPPKPTSQGNECPDGLDETEWPGALEKAVYGTETAGQREAENEPITPRLEGITDEHRRHRDQTEDREQAHRESETEA